MEDILALLLERQSAHLKVESVCKKAGKYLAAKENNTRADECAQIHAILITANKPTFRTENEPIS